MDVAIAATGLAFLTIVLLTHNWLHRAIRQPAPTLPPLRSYPSITVIRPVRGVDVGASENFAASLRVAYPGKVETLFVFDDARDPAVPLAQAAIAAHERSGAPGTARLIFSGHPPPGVTGKMNAMVVGVREAQGTLIAFGDSDTRPTPQALRLLVETLLGSPGAGAAFAPVVVARHAKTLGDAGLALMLNGLYGPGVTLVQRRTGSMPFIMGQLMVFRRETLQAIGGLDSIRGELVDDMHIGARVVSAGLLNVVGPEPLEIVVEDTSPVQFLRTYRRWLIFSRSGLEGWSFKWLYWLRGAEFFASLAVLVAALFTGHAVAGLVAALACVAFTWSTVHLHEELGGARLPVRHWWLPVALLLAAPFVFLSALLFPSVAWRGRTYQLDLGSRLATMRTAPPQHPV
jgi:ceramide glucosyltransferase